MNPIIQLSIFNLLLLYNSIKLICGTLDNKFSILYLLNSSKLLKFLILLINP